MAESWPPSSYWNWNGMVHILISPSRSQREITVTIQEDEESRMKLNEARNRSGERSILGSGKGLMTPASGSLLFANFLTLRRRVIFDSFLPGLVGNQKDARTRFCQVTQPCLAKPHKCHLNHIYSATKVPHRPSFFPQSISILQHFSTSKSFFSFLTR